MPCNIGHYVRFITSLVSFRSGSFVMSFSFSRISQHCLMCISLFELWTCSSALFALLLLENSPFVWCFLCLYLYFHVLKLHFYDFVLLFEIPWSLSQLCLGECSMLMSKSCVILCFFFLAESA